MPKITDISIQKNNKTRANVQVDGEFAFGLEMVTVMKLGLKIGQEVSAERLAEAVLDSDKQVAFSKAMNYLARSMKTTKQMREYLTKKGYCAQAVDAVVARLVELKYLNDDLYAQTYAKQSAPSKGQRRIKQELVQKGIAQSTAEIASMQDDQSALDAATALANKYVKNKPQSVKTLQGVQRYLLYRGYGYDTVNAVLAALKQNFANVEMEDVLD